MRTAGRRHSDPSEYECSSNSVLPSGRAGTAEKAAEPDESF